MTPSHTLSFQEIILRLLAFWQEQGCLVWHPYNVQVGAGTMNPATSLRVLGPEPWNVVYLEPSIRPDDGRFGENPNRMQQFYQLQVILKPDPGNPQELYLQSLQAIGINPRRHDIRFVEDNWESPVQGAWGLGWEVWLDGQEITQYTYFQQSGGQTLDPVSVELTYGLDRIALALQGADSVWEMDFGAGVPYGDVLLQSEIEHCRYYFEVADVDALRTVYDTYENEVRRCLEAGLVIPAHDYNLKCSHLFNVMDTRGAIGVTERANYFRRMRNMARRVSELHLEQRQRLEHPLLNNEQWQIPAGPAPAGERIQLTQIEQPQTFLLEIGSEELPAADLATALAYLKTAVPAFLADLRLDYERIEIHGTPRRLAVIVHRLAGRQADLESEVKGPPADRAFDPDGRPTRAAEGFARSRGVNVADLKVVEEADRRYVAAVVREEGKPGAAVLARFLPDFIAGIKFEKSMRWNQTNVAFSRPLRWFVALYGPDLIPFSYAGIESDRVSRGLRPYESPPITIADGAVYREVMAENHVVLEVAQRRQQIAGGAARLAAEVGGVIQEDNDLLAEIANLVERPTPLRGRFEERFLSLPAPILVAVMKKHQRYFPVYAPDGRLLPYFIAVRNGDDAHLDVVAAGNEHVIRARFADADFFYQRDSRQPLSDFLPRLDTLTFQTDLGSMLDKTRRLEQLTPQIAPMLGLNEAETAAAARAATLAKADLATQMVVEMTALQGTMGGIYAARSGEEEAVAAAIAEQYQAVSRTRPGLALALADRLDSLTGLFAAGLVPKGSKDPFALRRAAIQTIENLLANEQSFDLRAGLQAAAALLPIAIDEKSVTAVLDFISGRLEALLEDQGHRPSVVRAILAEQRHNPHGAALAATALSRAIEAEDWPRLLDAYARCVRLIRSQPQGHTFRPEMLALPEEQALYAAYQEAAGQGDASPKEEGRVQSLVAALHHLEPAISRFFDAVLVMDEDLAVRHNRLALLQHIAGLAHGIADLSQLEGF
jgi:glycyl-tRNA synthetase